MTTTTPRQAVEALLAAPRLPEGDDERFTGYGVMGMPFASGHYLGLRDMAATSVGPAYRSIWHRDPEMQWTIHTTEPPEVTCPRYFGAATATGRAPVAVSWQDDHTFEVAMGDVLRWRVELGPTPATRIMTAMGGMLPAPGWNSDAVLGAMGPMARTMLRTGRIRLRGATPNGQHFKAAPLRIWRVVGGSATYLGQDLGAPAPLDSQTGLGDFWMPQRGIFFVGHARFTAPVAQDGHAASTAGARLGR